MNFPESDIFFPLPSRSDGLSPTDYVRRLASDRLPAEGEGATTEKGPRSPSPVAIAGAGLMGRSIAAAFLRREIPIFLFDSFPEALASAPERIVAELAFQLSDAPLESGKPSDEWARRAAERVERLLTPVSDPAQLDQAETILETIVEKAKVKRKFYRELDAVCQRPKRLLSNTSTLKITDLSAGLVGLRHFSPADFCGFHFFHPVRKRSLLEIIRGAETSDETIRTASILARRIDKTPIVVADGPGFLVNRLLNPYLDEAMAILLEGVSIDRIETACRRFGMEMGPFRIMDEIGLDVTFHSGWTFFQAFPDLISSLALLPLLIRDGRLGRKNGRGFRRYSASGNWEEDGTPDPTLDAVIAEGRKNRPRSPLWSGDGASRRPLNGPEISDEMIAARIFGGILFEAGRIMADGIVTDFTEVDRGLVFGLGFPKSRGGIAFWAETLGPESIRALSDTLAPLGPKFRLVPEIFEPGNPKSLFQ